MQSSLSESHTELREKVGARIRRRRTELGLTMRALGELVPNASGKPTPDTQVSKWERGVNLPTQRQWAPIAAALSTDVASLFAGLSEEPADWSDELGARVALVEDQIDQLARLLGLEGRDALRPRRRRQGPSPQSQAAVAAFRQKATGQGRRKARATRRKPADD